MRGFSGGRILGDQPLDGSCDVKGPSTRTVPENRAVRGVRTAVLVLGFAALWTCLQSAGFYPLALVRGVEGVPAITVAAFHLVYGVAVVLFALASFALAQAFQCMYYALDLPRAPLFLLAPVVCAAGVAAGWDRSGGPVRSVGQDAGRVAALKALPWRMLLPALFFIFFVTVFVRIRISTFSGDSTLSSKSMTAAVALIVTLAALFVTVRGRRTGVAGTDAGAVDDALTVRLFAFYAVAAIVAMTARLITEDFPVAVFSRAMVAVEHCIELLVWTILARRVRSAGLPSVPVFAFYLVAVAALTWIVSFDVYYLAGLDAILPSVPLAVPAISIALTVLAAGVIAYLLRLSTRPSAGSGSLDPALAAAGASDPAGLARAAVERACERAGAELTPSELNVAALVSRGYSARRVSDELGLSEATVKTYTSRVYHKFGVASKQEFIALVEKPSLPG